MGVGVGLGDSLEDEPPLKVRLRFNPGKSSKQERIEMLRRRARVALAPFLPGGQIFLYKAEASLAVDFKLVAIAIASNSAEAMPGFSRTTHHLINSSRVVGLPSCHLFTVLQVKGCCDPDTTPLPGFEKHGFRPCS